MHNTFSLSDFVTLTISKSGRPKAACSPEQQANIYAWMKNQGFGIARTDDKPSVFRRRNDLLETSSIIQIKNTFRAFLESEPFDDWPDDKDRSILTNWCYTMPPLIQDKLFRKYLDQKISEEEIDSFTTVAQPDHT